MLTHRFESWSDFKSNYAASLPSRSDESLLGRYIFRGQGDAGWQLTSSFDRRYASFAASRRQQEYLKWISWFSEELRWQPEFAEVSDPLKIMGLAQHYGLPTRLLDWSLSPYVAAFFAYAEGHGTESLNYVSPAIWVIDLKKFQKAVPSEDVEILAPIDHQNRRLRNQSGLFTFLKTEDVSLDCYLERVAGEALSCVTCFILPPSNQDEALEDLSLMGVDYRSVRPEIEGIAYHVQMRSIIERARGTKE